MKRWVVRLVFPAIVALVATACTAQQSQQNTGAPSPSSGPVTINILWIGGGGYEVFIHSLVQSFEKEHPNITVEVTQIPEDNYVTKIDTALAAGSAPDLGYMYEPRWIKAGRILPLEDVIASHQIDISNYNQNALQSNFSFCQLDGKTYCLGSYAGSNILFYNRGLFDKAGLPYPSATEPMTVDQYAALAAKLTQANQDRSKYVWGGSASVTTWWADLRPLFNEDGTKVEGYLNDAPTEHMYTVLADMIRQGDAPSDSDLQFLGATDPLATGQLAMTIADDTVGIPTLEKAGIDWGAAPAPVEEAGDPPWVSSWTDAWCAFNTGDPSREEAAKEFVAFVATDGGKLRAALPPGSEARDVPPLDLTVAEDTGWAGDSPGRAEVLQVMKLAHPGIFLPAIVFTIDPPLWDAFSLMVEDGTSAQQALNKAAQEMQQNLDRAWQTWNET